MNRRSFFLTLAVTPTAVAKPERMNIDLSFGRVLARHIPMPACCAASAGYVECPTCGRERLRTMADVFGSIEGRGRRAARVR